jgi:chorismate synthase
LNSYGKIFRISIVGESHGEYSGVLIDGCPAGLLLKTQDFLPDLERRQGGKLGTTSRRESDIPLIKCGLYKQKTTGAPLLIMFENKNVQSDDYLISKNTPRPGHADFVAHHKYGGFNDSRGGGQFSGRLTVGIVAAGVIAKKILEPVSIKACVTEVGGVKDVKMAVKSAASENDSIGGIIQCRTIGLPVGLGEPFFDSVESTISHLIFAIPGIKGIEFGSGFACSRMKGSEFNDDILDLAGKTRTNNAGGINGGITNGNELTFRIAVKPPASIIKEQRSINLRTGKKERISIIGRHDVCIALRMPAVVEAAAAIVLADLMLLEQRISRILK